MQLENGAQDTLPLEDEETRERAGLVPLHGVWIAVASFVPAFLTIFFGIPYLAGLPVASRVPVSLQRSTPPVVLSPLSRESGFVGAPPQEPAPMIPMRAVERADELARVPSTPTTEVSGTAAIPSPTPAAPRPASPPTRPQVEPEAAEAKRSASAVTKGPVWVLGAAFSDRDSAERLAASVEHQGYPAKVRRDNTSSTPWVVWIGQHPRATTPSERRKYPLRRGARSRRGHVAAARRQLFCCAGRCARGLQSTGLRHPDGAEVSLGMDPSFRAVDAHLQPGILIVNAEEDHVPAVVPG
jgi:hypothetical protein